MNELNPTVVKKLRAVKKAILSQPEFYDQRSVGDMEDPCGSACCIAGWLVYLDNPKRYKRLVINGGIICRADAIVGEDTGGLFGSGGYWPDPFCSSLQSAKTPKKRAEAAAGMIDHFIKTGEC